MHALQLSFARSTHGVVAPMDKLQIRSQLPGAFGYDQGAHTMRMARAKGLGFQPLLACAMPGSWMVNNRAPSTVFRQWLTPPMLDVWVALCEALSGGYTVWLERTRDEKKMVGSLVRALAVEGQGIAAISKVLAYCVMESVPLMDDAMVLAALGDASGLTEPVSADDPKSAAPLFIDVMDWFAQQCLTHESALIQIARDYKVCTLDVAQVLDRVLWFDTWGWTYNYGAGKQFARVTVGSGDSCKTLIVPNPTGGAGERKEFSSLKGLSEHDRAHFDRVFTAV